MIREAARLWSTVRWLRPRQVIWRLWLRLYRPRPETGPAPPQRQRCGDWCPPIERPASMRAPDEFVFLNETARIVGAEDWNAPNRSKLWLYHLHYFDDLNAEGASNRQAWHRDLIARWTSENPVCVGNGWEPYPVSRRVVNWTKWALAGNRLQPEWVHSLAVQTRWLRRRLERHLLGNHLLANAKALVFAGALFEGAEPEGWLRRGLGVLRREIPEQVLEDGGHFERSPMYHAIVLEDLLDLINLAACIRGVVPEEHVRICRGAAERMLPWLAAMSHPDGGIAFFNDAVLGEAAAPGELRAYADRLGLAPPRAAGLRRSDGGSGCAVVDLPDSGYLRVEDGELTALLDLAPVGPGYLPGHAHADTLSFELSLGTNRILVNGGCSTYERTAQRLRERGTEAHNTVVVDGRNSSDVWASFRVGRRARPFGQNVEGAADRTTVTCAHDGYRHLRGHPVHWRTWGFRSGELTVRDRIAGRCRTARAYYHFHPDVRVELNGERGKVVATTGAALAFEVVGGDPALTDTEFHPEFGRSVTNRTLEVSFGSSECTVRFRWGGDAHPVS